MRLNHVQLHVSDIGESRRFYARHFGLVRAVHEEPGFVILAAEDGGLLALHLGAPPDPSQPTGHFGFQVADVAGVVAADERFVAEGLAVSARVISDDGFAFARVIDPDGHHVEVYALPST